ncbi:MAG TPA: hypothetical protein VNO30_40400 [Kofleriaceae bacterium]|nr:hypothetical protein [Kofleriaceae bacterium]
MQGLSKELKRLQATGEYEWSIPYQSKLGVTPPLLAAERQDLLEGLQEDRGLSLCDDVVEIYKSFYEIRLGWASKTFRRDRLSGNFNLTTLCDLYLENPEEPRELPGDLGFPAKLGEYRLFDWLGARERTVIRLCGKGQKPELVCLFEGRTGRTDRLIKYPLKLSPAEYVKLGCLAFGLYGWQHFFVEGKRPVRAARNHFAARLEALVPSSASEFIRLAGF